MSRAVWITVCLLSQLACAQELPDFSLAGYGAGARPLPEPEAVLDIRDFGARGDGESDCAPALRAAIEAGAGRVIFIPEGRWRLESEVLISADSTVLLGAGSARSVFVCPHSLADIHGPSPSWSWSGGMLRLRSGRASTGVRARVVGATPAGGDTLHCVLSTGSAPIVVGAWLELQWFNDKGVDSLLDVLYGGVIARKRMGSELRESDEARVREWVQVAEVGEGWLRIAHPLRLELRPEWQGRLVGRPSLHEVGLSGLGFEFAASKYPGHLKEAGYNAIELIGGIDCWMRDIAIENADSGIFVNGSRFVTVQEVAITGRTMHHCLSASWTSDCLFSDWRIDCPHIHGTTVSWGAHGNVFERGRGYRLRMDCHRAASFENLHTDIEIDHRGKLGDPLKSGGSGPRGPHSARANVYWNIRHILPAGEGPVQIGPYNQWPRAVFAGWSSEQRAIELVPAEGLEQQLLPQVEIENLYRAQRGE